MLQVISILLLLMSANADDPCNAETKNYTDLATVQSYMNDITISVTNISTEVCLGEKESPAIFEKVISARKQYTLSVTDTFALYICWMRNGINSHTGAVPENFLKICDISSLHSCFANFRPGQVGPDFVCFCHNGESIGILEADNQVSCYAKLEYYPCKFKNNSVLGEVKYKCVKGMECQPLVTTEDVKTFRKHYTGFKLPSFIREFIMYQTTAVCKCSKKRNRDHTVFCPNNLAGRIRTLKYFILCSIIILSAFRLLI